MIIAIVILFAILLYVSNILSYTLGVKHGREVKQGGTPTINPVKVVKQVQKKKEEEKTMDKMVEGINNILNYGE